MDSFCFPTAPCPSKKPFLEPSVPEASLLMNAPQHNTYQAWRNNFCNSEQSKKMTSILKKQVRFDSPSVPCFEQVQKNFNTEMQQAKEMTQCSRKSTPETNTPPLNKVLKNRPFQEIYMANIPNRHLDLSLIDLNKPVCSADSNQMKHPTEVVDTNSVENINKPSIPPNKAPSTYREFLEMQRCLKHLEKSNQDCEVKDHIIDIFNYGSPKMEQKNRQAPVEIKTDKFNCTKNDVLRNRNENHSGNLNKGKFDSFSNKSSIKGVIGKENLWCDNGKISPHQLMTSSKKASNLFDTDKNLQELHMLKMKQTCENSVQTSVIETSENICKQIEKPEIAQKSDDPTVKDLLKIIQQQNEQLLVLQKQVASLLDFKEKQKCIEPTKQWVNDDNKFKQQMQEHKDYLNSAGSTPRRGPLPKFSIDLMTSFEVSFRPQQNINPRKQRDFVHPGPKIQEIVEAESDTVSTNNVQSRRVVDPSLYLQEPITVQENCPSPEPSINIDMKDYESSDEDNEDSTSDIGASFYKKMMDQVNNIIQNAQRQATFDGKMAGSEELRERTLSKVRDATIKQLKKINMNFSPIEEVSDCSNASDHTTEQINLAVKQLLMKYLPNDQLTKLHKENEVVLNKKQSSEKIVLNSRAPQFSFATVQFMKKYDLIANDGNDVHRRPDIQEKPKSTRVHKLQYGNPKILDISTLKQQPKLL